MSKRPGGVLKYHLTANEASVLDALLAVSPEFAMVDDSTAIESLVLRGMAEAGERVEGDVVQPVYRITPSGADAYGRMNGVFPVYLVS